MSRISDVVNKIMQISDEMNIFYLVRITVIQCAGNKFTIILVQEWLFFVKNRAKI